MSTNNAIPPLEERIRARLAAAKTLSSASRHTAELSISQTAIKPVRLLHLWEDRVTNARTDEVLFTISSAPRQTRHIFLRPGIVVTTAATNEQICTIRFGTRKTSSFRMTALPDRREVKISNTRRRWAFTPTNPATATTAASTATTTTDPKAVSSSSSISTTTTTTTKQPVWIWQRDTTGGTSPSVILIEDKEQKTHTLAARRVLARISVNLLSFPSLDSITADSWLEIVMTAIGLAQHVRNWCKYGSTLEGAGGIVMIFDGGCGGDGGSGGGDGGGGCGGDGGGGGGGGGGGDGGS